MDVARRFEPGASQARALEQHVLRCVGALPTDRTAGGRARLAVALLTGRNGTSADAVQILFRVPQCFDDFGTTS